MIATIAQAEFRRLWLTPLPWVLMAIMQFALTFLYLVYTDNFLTELQPKLALVADAPGATDSIIAPTLIWAGMLWMGIIPLLTMRSFEVQAQALLLTAPMTSLQITLGKFAGLCLTLTTLLLPLLLTLSTLGLGTTPDWGKLAAGMGGLLLMLCSFSAAGLFLALVARQTAAAAGMSYGLMATLYVFYIAGTNQANTDSPFTYLSHFGHYLNMTRGLIFSVDLIYFALFSIGFLALTVHRLEIRRRGD
jgi:ABC-2 type transport system permease protein